MNDFGTRETGYFEYEDFSNKDRLRFLDIRRAFGQKVFF